MHGTGCRCRRSELMRRATVFAAVLAVLMLALAGPGVRLGLWTFRTGFHLLQWGAYLGLAAAAVAVVLLLVPATRAPSAAPLVVALGTGRSRSRRSTTSPPTFATHRSSSPCCRSEPTRPIRRPMVARRWPRPRR